jgi:conjugal transfer pilus assembly protein TraA
MLKTSLNMSEEATNRFLLLAGLIVLSIIMASMAHAGTDTTFEAWVTEMEDWLEGSLGKGIAIACVIVGAVAGLMRQSMAAFGIGIGFALGLLYTPDIIDSMFTAVL